MKKRIFALMLAMMMVFSLAACGGSDSSDDTSADTASADADTDTDTGTSSEIETVTDGVLTVATSPDFAPFEFYAVDEDGNVTLAGIDISLAQYIADYLGLELEMVTVDFDGVLTELASGSVDLGLAGLSPDEDRLEVMDFSDAYYTGGQSVVTTQDKADQFTSLEDTNDPSVTVGVQTGAIQVDLAEEYSPNADIVSLPKVTDLITDLLAGNMDVAYMETTVAQSYQNNYPDLAIVLEVPYDVEGFAVGVNKGNEALLAGVNEAIAQAIEDGSIETFVAEANDLASGDTYEGLLEDYE